MKQPDNAFARQTYLLLNRQNALEGHFPAPRFAGKIRQKHEPETSEPVSHQHSTDFALISLLTPIRPIV
jgi:hypothetical protein